MVKTCRKLKTQNIGLVLGLGFTTGTAVSWGIHLFQVPFHPVWVERRLARVEVSRLPARHVGGPRVKV